jgi:ankyrin repeat protein
MRGDLAELEALLAAGADAEAQDKEHGGTAFYWACDAGQLECAQALAAVGRRKQTWWIAEAMAPMTALMAAAEKGHATVVAWLLGESGATGNMLLEARDPDPPLGEGSTAFLFACFAGQLECAQVLAAWRDAPWRWRPARA